VYDDIGIEKREEALERRKSALHIRRTAYENATTKRRNDEIMVYASEMEYSISLLHYHRYAAAEAYIEKCLAKYREWGNEDEIPFEYAKYYNKIGLVKMYQGKFEDAIRLSERGVQLMEKTDYNLFAARFKFDMACIIHQSGDSERALQVHEGIYTQRVEMLGPTNRLSLHSLYAIGAIHEMEGRLDEAEYVCTCSICIEN
jgi:tetratricopeptide (TPR) repeat protein